MIAVPHQQGTLAEGAADEDVEIFDVAASWRYEAIKRLGLEGESMITAASPGAVFPQMVDFVIRNVEAAQPGTIVDIGAGLAGVAETVRQASGRCVLAFEASSCACDGARNLFPEVQLTQAYSSRLPVRDCSVAAVLACGLLSVLTDPHAMMCEARRVIREQGCFVVVDLASASPHPVSVGGKVFSSAERIVASLADAGFALLDQAIGVTSLSDWALADAAIARDIAVRRRRDAGFDHWLDDRRRFERLMSSARVMMIGVAATPC